MRDAIAITGLGVVCALGRGAAALREGLFAGRDGIVPLDRFDVSPFGRKGFAALVPDAPPRERWIAYALEAAREAVASVDLTRFDPARVAVVMGTSLGRDDDLGAATRAVAAALRAQGPCFTVSTACTSSTNAVGLARDLLLRGDADLVLAGGTDEVTLALFAGFHALGVLADDRCGPFGPTLGTTLGEGAGFVVLARDADRAAPALGYVAGYGLASDAFHETSPDPRGAGVTRAMRGALSDAGWSPGDVDYVNAHATGTAANDASEWLGTEAALGEVARRIPISASKGSFGHAQGAAGVIELIASLVCVREGRVPASKRAEGGRRGVPPDVVPGDIPRAHPVARFLTTNSAFGGANAVLAIARAPASVPVTARPVYLHGVGVVRDSDARAVRDDVSLRARVPSADPRALDPLARFVLAASAASLDDAGMRLAGDLRDRAGIILAAPRVSPASGRAWQRALDGRGRPSVSAFARLVLHAAAGSTTKVLSLRGPASTLAGGAGAGLAAVALAAELIASRADVDVMVAAGAEEDPDARADREGAAAVALGSAPGAVRLAGSAVAGAEHAARAMDAAVARGGGDVARWYEAPEGACASVAALARAAMDVRSGAVKRVGVVARDAVSSCAVVLERTNDGR